MPVDLLLDQATGDLVPTAGNDVALVSGSDEIEQRIRTHIKVQLGAYQLDPTLGSTANSLLRLPVAMAVSQLPLVVKEALAQMSDISVQDVAAWPDPDDPRKARFTVSYTISNDNSGDVVSYNDSLVVTS